MKTRLRRVSLKQMRALTETVKRGSLSAAARGLNVTPPAIKLQLAQLEDAVGFPLYERTAGGVALTDAGREVVSAFERIQSAMIDCALALDALGKTDTGRIAVGATTTANYFVPRILAAFARRHPGVDVRLHVGNRETVIDGLRSLDLDLAVMGTPPPDFAAEKALIGEHPYVIIGPPDHPALARRKLRLRDLRSERFLLREEGSGTRRLTTEFFYENGLDPEQGVEMGGNETIKQAVMAGLGIALISSHTVAAELREGRLGVFPVARTPVLRAWYVVKLESKRLMPAARSLWEMIAERGHEHLPPAQFTPRGGRPSRKRAQPPAPVAGASSRGG